MQQKLAQIATIPIIIQSTLQSVSRTFEAFLPPAPDSNHMQIINEMDDSISVDSLEDSSSDDDDDDENNHFVHRHNIHVNDDSSTSDSNANHDSDEKSSSTASSDESESRAYTDDSNKIITPIVTPEPLEPTAEELEKMRKQSKVGEF